MAILFCGIVMSHYTHFNLSPMTQITVQQIFRTTAFMAGIWYMYVILCVWVWGWGWGLTSDQHDREAMAQNNTYLAQCDFDKYFALFLQGLLSGSSFLAILNHDILFWILYWFFLLVLISETCVFAYLGMAIFSFKHQFRPAFVIWTIVSIIVCILVNK